MKKVMDIMMLFVMLAMMLMMSGCQNPQGGGVAEPPDTPNVVDTANEGVNGGDTNQSEKDRISRAANMEMNVGYMPNYGSLWAVINAKEQGYLKQEGVNIHLMEYVDGVSVMKALESGEIDVGYIGQGAHRLCIEGDIKIFALSNISNGDVLIARKGILSVEDLHGRNVGYTAGSSGEIVLMNALQRHGMSMKDIQAVDMLTDNIASAMLSGRLDACATWPPYSLQIMKMMPDAVKLADNLTFANDTISLSGWAVSPEYAEENRELLVKFTGALFRAMDYAADENFQETSDYIAKLLKQKPEDVYVQKGDGDWLTGKEVAEGAADGTVKNYYQIQQKGFIRLGLLKHERPVEEYVLLDVMVEAGE